MQAPASLGREAVALSQPQGSPVDVQGQAVGLPPHRRGVGFQQETAQELDEGLLVSKLVQLVHQGRTKLVLLTA